MNIIIRDVPRPDAKLVQGFQGIATGVLSDAMGRCNAKDAAGAINVPVSCGGVAVCPGDIILGDADGVVVIPREHAADVLKAAQATVAKEQQVRQRIELGEYLFDMLKLGDVLKSLDVTEQ